MPRNGFRNGPTPQALGEATEDFRIYIDEIFRDFISQNSVESYDFPSDLNNILRKYIHEKCRKLGIKSKSHGKEPNRTLTIYKKIKVGNVETFQSCLSTTSSQILSSIRNKRIFHNSSNNCKRQKVHNVTTGESVGRLFVGQLNTVDRAQDNPLMEFRRTLPIHKNKEHILEMIRVHPVVIVSAETGSGKTTQIPQFLLDEACLRKDNVRVICTQPRRLSTIAVAERVASERGEKIGHTVGYQIKLESKLGPRTSLVYCTNGVLLRTLMAGYDCFKNITHVIVDEIHERDKFTDFLLICLRECLTVHRHLRVILMSATMDMDIFVKYFKNVHVINVDGRSHQITSWFLDDILLQINYENENMKRLRMLREKNGTPQRKDALIAPPKIEFVTELEGEVREELNSTIRSCFENGTESDFTNLMQLILNESASPNYQEDIEGRTALMAASKNGNLEILEQLLNMGADPYISCTAGLTASGWAQKYSQFDVVNVLSMYQTGSNTRCQETLQILADYDRSFNEDLIDFDLIIHIVKFIHENLDKRGAILVFLPGYDDIINCHDRIMNAAPNSDLFKIFMLHSSMQMSAQHEVFLKLHNRQKIILSTNLAETSITIDDVRYVIDTGKAKEKTYDAMSGISSLKTQWISMASARQRAGRAGRTQNGYCFHLYSFARYESLCFHTTPEILRVPLHELCLQTKMLAPNDMSIEGFLNLAIEPPSIVSVKNSINALKNLGALDIQENLTNLGHHLIHLSIEPHLGKMLIFSVIFKCLDPVLSIVACLAHKDPFILPTQGSLKNFAVQKRKAFSDGTLSDHYALLKAFQLWQNNKVRGNTSAFCEENFISPASMEMIMMTRTQLMSQLRAVGFVNSNYKDNIMDVNQNAEAWPLVKACIASGLYPNVAFYNDKKLHTRTEKFVVLNMSSSLKNSEFDHASVSNKTQKCWIIFEEISKNNLKCSIKCATLVSPLTIALVCGLEHEVEEGTSMLLDNWFDFDFYNSDVSQFRLIINSIIEKKINMPRNKISEEEDEIISALVQILIAEDEESCLKLPVGVGARPKILHCRSNSSEKKQYRRQQQSTHQNRNGNGYRSYQQQQQYSQFSSHQQFQPPDLAQPGPSHQNDSYRSDSHRSHQNQNFYRHRQDTVQKNYTNPPWSWQTPESNRFGRYNSSEKFPIEAHYYIIKPCEIKNVQIGIQQGLWNFAPSTERKLFHAFYEGVEVILIFTVRNTNHFQGVARLVNTNMDSATRTCPIEWLSVNEISFNEVKKFIHPKIHLIEDGFRLDSIVGQKLCSYIYDSPRPDHRRPILGNQGHFNRAWDVL